MLSTSDMKMEAMPAITAYLTVIIEASLLAANYLHLTKMVISLENATWNPGGAAIFAALDPCCGVKENFTVPNSMGHELFLM